VARNYIAQHAQELGELALAGAAEGNASAEQCLRWLERFGYIAAPEAETSGPEPAAVAGPVVRRRGDKVWWG
jgi:hypothetical protein